MGLTYIMVSPRHLLVTWDDETHYLRSVSLADVLIILSLMRKVYSMILSPLHICIHKEI